MLLNELQIEIPRLMAYIHKEKDANREMQTGNHRTSKKVREQRIKRIELVSGILSSPVWISR
jgi:hypothetical protein